MKKTFDDIQNILKSIELKGNILLNYKQYFTKEELNEIKNVSSVRKSFEDYYFYNNDNEIKDIDEYYSYLLGINNILLAFIEYLKENNLYISESLTQYLIRELLEETTKTIALYPGKFKPPHAGHFDVAKGLLDKADEVRIVISPVPMDGVTAEQSKAVWELYNTLVGGKFTIIIADKSPVKYVLDAIKDNPNYKFIAAFGKGEAERYKSLVGKPNVEIVDGGTFKNLNARDLRAMIASDQDISKFLPKGITKDQYINTLKGTIEELEDYEIKYWALHADVYSALKKNPDEVYNTLKNKLTGDRLKALEYFYNEYFTQPASLQEGCGCMHTQQPTDFKQALSSLTKYMVDQGLNIKPLPKLKIINNDSKNAENILGRTAYYDPQDKSITLYTLNRHPKDVLRSYSHEMIHRIQDNEGRLNNVNTTNTNEDSNLQELEKEAYLNGNIIFRNWEDSIKNQKHIKEYKEYFLNELFEKDLSSIEKVSPLEYIVGNKDDIEAKYYFKLEIPEKDIWSLNWEFTKNNKNTSPEAWKQVTTTSLKILTDFIKSKHPKSIHISGNTDTKTSLYKNYITKLQILLNNKYKIDNSDEYKVVLRSIEEIAQSNIKKRMDTLNESYDQALNYWQNGGINSNSKIERWNAIKRKVEREILQEVYKIK